MLKFDIFCITMKRVTALKLAIVASGRAQRDLALELGLHESQLSRIVNGLQTDAGTRYAIADALGREHDELWPPPERPAVGAGDAAAAADPRPAGARRRRGGSMSGLLAALPAPAVAVLAALGALVAAAVLLLLAAGLVALALDGLRALRRRARRDDAALDAARSAFYAEIDRVAVVSELGDEVAANVFPLPRREPAEVVPFPTKPAA